MPGDIQVLGTVTGSPAESRRAGHRISQPSAGAPTHPWEIGLSISHEVDSTA